MLTLSNDLLEWDAKIYGSEKIQSVVGHEIHLGSTPTRFWK